jgi:TolB-like protein/Tfp pilus assembly protein PilF
VTIVALAAAVWGYLTFLGGPAYERLAVLPPANLMNDPEQEYFVQGVHTALISELQRAGIVVIARTSVLQYENTQKRIREIAAELGVDALIESSVFRAGDSVEMEARLVDGETEQYVAEPITRGGQLRDVMSLYRNLSSAIASEIHAALTPQAEAVLASARPVNPQAYDAYLRGIFHEERMTPTDLDQALEYFQQALSLDSTYALAHQGIVLVWIMRGVAMLTTPREAAAKASIAVRQALALDSTLAEVQYAVGAIRHWLDWDWAGAEAAYLKAIEINPNYANARGGYALFLRGMGRLEEARAQMERTLELDPLNALVRAVNGGLLCHEGRYAESISEFETALRIQPDHPAAYSGLAWAYHMLGNYDEALAMLRRWLPIDRELDEALDRGYEEGGYRAALLRYAETLAARPGTAELLSWIVVNMYAWAGEKERTLEWLDLAYQAHDLNLPAGTATPDFELVHDDPRYQALRRRMGLPQ